MLTMKVDESTPSRDLKPSPELFEMIQAAASSLTGFAQLWESIRKKGNSEGFTDEQLQWLLRPLLQNKLGMSKDKIYYLFHKEEVKERTKGYYTKVTEPYRKKSLIEDKKEPEESYKPDPDWNNEEQEIRKIGEIRRAEEKREDDEDPKDLEIQFLKEKVAELEDALKKTEQFKPATALQPEEDDDDINIVTIRAGIGVIADMIRLELPKLKNRGWKVVEVKFRAV